MIKAVIFDCFGVLITDALGAMVSEIRETKPNEAQEILSILTAAAKGQISRQHASEAVSTLFGMTMDEYINSVQNAEVKNYELLDYIVELRKTYKTAMLSNVSIGGLAARFEKSELERCFDEIVASGDIGYAKPEPEAYEIAADRLGMRLEECVFIDDREEYCEGARGVGMQAIQYKSMPQMKRELGDILKPSSQVQAA
jgi:HAD superfamily hydrolase (TIGR01509 family)